MNIRPLGEKVVIKKLEAQEKTKSGILLPNQAQEKPQIAEVMAVGPGGMVDGKEILMQVKVGDKVIFPKFAGTEVKLDGTEYTIIEESKLLGIIEE
ncbi:MAG: co-chaperone GroES [Acidaminobacteraceae bacterium]